MPNYDTQRYRKIITYDASGNVIGASNPLPVEITDGTNTTSVSSDGQLHVVQEGKLDENNSTTTPLLAAATFTGVATDISAYATIAIVVETDVASAIHGLAIQFSSDNITWHDGEKYTLTAGATRFFTPPAQQKYYRLIYTNGGVDQLAFHLHSMLKKTPIKWSSKNINEAIYDEDDAELVKAVITGKRTDGSFDNVNLTNGNNMKISLEELEVGISSNSKAQLNVTQFLADGTEGMKIADSIIPSLKATVSSNRNLQVSTPVRLVGNAFDNSTLDTNFWTPTITNGGNIIVQGEVELATSAIANGTAKLESIRKGRFVVGNPMEFKTTCEWYSVGNTDNLRRIGCYDVNNGYFFQLDGTTFSIGTRTNRSGGPVDTLVNSGSFNGDSTTFVPGISRHKCAIQYTTSAVFFLIDGVLIHKVTLDHANSATTFTFPITMENNNDNGNTTDNYFHAIGAIINRLGARITNPQYYHLSGNAATHILKYSAGILNKIMFNNTSGISITIYDNYAASGNVIGIITTTSGAIGEWRYRVPFNNGLTLVTTGNGLDATIVYE